jgi:uncharacterized tellurite resistance protein B-like protein
MNDDPRIAIARLAAALMVADARVTSTELAALAGLERLGLGSLEAATREALIEAAEAPIDVSATCAALSAIGPDAGALVLAVLADIVTSDGVIDPREGELLAQIGLYLRVPGRERGEIIHGAATRNAAAAERTGHAIPVRPDDEAVERAAAPPRTPGVPSDALAGAYAVLGLQVGAPLAAVESAYRAIVERYQPAKVIDLGPEFAVLAVRRLAAATAAFTRLCDSDERQTA